MDNSSYIALSRQRAISNEMTLIANNIANANTTGFKREALVFQEFVQKPSHDSHRVSYAYDVGTARDIRDGSLQSTGNSLDVALTGSGYFTVETPAGPRYTRNGHFQLNADSQLVNSSGHPVLSNGSPITIPSDQGSINIATDGTISNGAGELGKLDVVNFENPRDLKKAAGGLYVTNQEPQAAENYKVTQGMLEESNVEPILEITRMLQVQRDYGSIQKLTKSEDDRLKKAIERLGTFS